MSVTFTDADAGNLPFGFTSTDSLSDILTSWDDLFTGSHTNITGTFAGTADNSWYSFFGVPLSGETYTYGSDADGYKFVATGDLYYYFSAAVTPASPASPDDHTLFGELDSVSLYTDADGDGAADDLFLTINFDAAVTGAITEGQDNDVFQIIHALMEGDVSELLSELTSQGIDITDSFADLTGSSALGESELLLAA